MSMSVSEDLTLIIGGDLHVQRADPESAFRGIAPVLHGADLVFGNLEGIPSDVGEKTKGKQTGGFKPDESMLAAYRYARFAAVGLANNHSMDFGAPALLRCIELLDEAGIAHTGGGHTVEEARRPAVIERKGTRVGLLSYSTVFIPEYAATPERPGIATIRVTAYDPPPRLIEAPGARPSSGLR
jgi:poly-gamma-glutamate capsule biosynthesis protein CapA/YwtB (metallophosphatase superfamily)